MLVSYILFQISNGCHHWLFFPRKEENDESAQIIENLTQLPRRIIFHCLLSIKFLTIFQEKNTSYSWMGSMVIIKFRQHQRIRTRPHSHVHGENFLMLSYHLVCAMHLKLSKELLLAFFVTYLQIVWKCIWMTLPHIEKHLKKPRITWTRFYKDAKTTICP